MGAVNSRSLQLNDAFRSSLWLATLGVVTGIAYWKSQKTLKKNLKDGPCGCGNNGTCGQTGLITETESTTDESDNEDNDLEDLASDHHVSRPPRLGQGEVLPKVGKVGAAANLTAATAASDQALLPGRQRIHVKTFGCPHNQSDGEYLAGQLKDYGYTLVDSLEDSDAIVINSCTVKHPSETRALNLVSNAQNLGKGVVLAGCVPSSNRQLADKLEGVSMLDVTQLDRIVEVVEETVKGNTVKVMEKRSDLPSLSLPKVRKHRLAEIITINAGCLGSCTYCKTKMSRGKVWKRMCKVLWKRWIAFYSILV